MQEVRARGGELYVFADADTAIAPADNMHVIQMPETTVISRPCCMRCLCSFWRITRPWRAAPTLTNRGISQKA